jgi:hypothetical protein
MSGPLRGEHGALEKGIVQRRDSRDHPELIRLAVEDVLDQRKPRW